MEVILGIVITSLFWAVCFFLYLAEKNKHDALTRHEEIRILREENRILREEKEHTTLAVPSRALSNNSDHEKLTNIINEKDDEISRLKNSFRNKDNQISRLNVSLREKENEISRLRNAPRERDENLYRGTYLESELYQKKREITELEKILREKDKEIKRVTSLENEYVNEIQKLNKKLYEKETEIETLNIKRERLKQLLREKDKEIEKLKKELEGKKQPTGKRFVSVKFYRNSPDKFDYFMGKITDLKIGDYVMVPVKGTLKPATVCYISKLGEISQYARSEIVSKIDKIEQMSLFD